MTWFRPRTRPAGAVSPTTASLLLSVLLPSVLLLSLLLLASACGVPTDSDVELIDAEGFAALTDPEDSDSTGATTPLLVEGDEFALYFINGNQELQSVVRPFADGTTQADLVQALVSGPTEDERAAAVLVTRLQPTAAPQIIRNEDGTMTILVADAAEVRNDENLRDIFGQLVCTMGRLVGVARVAVEDAEGPIPFSPGDGEPQPTVSIEEYGGCEPQSTLLTTTVPDGNDVESTGTETETDDG